MIAPDYSDSDSNFSDDPDYYDFKEKIRNRKLHVANDHVLTEEEQKEQSKKAFYSALCSGNTKSVISFLDDGLDVNTNFQDDWTPLLLSASFGNYDITEELLKRGAKANTVRNGVTALMMACSCPAQTSPFDETYKVVRLLVENGANVKSINRKRMTALMYAANTGNLNAVKYLFPLSNKDAVDNQRWTVLFWAVSSNAVDVVEYLLEQGVEYNLTDVRNDTPLDIALNNNFEQIVSLLSKDNTDNPSNILSSYPTDYEEIISLKCNKRPQFFLDVSGMLSGVRCDSAVTALADKKIGFFDFLSATYEDLKNWGIAMPYQRERIMGGIHTFHQHPFHPDSLHIVPLDANFSNLDATIQLISTIKQIIAMEASLAYMRKRYEVGESTEDQDQILKNLKNIRNKIKLCQIRNKELIEKAKQWDSRSKSVDVINKDSIKFRPPWRKLLFASLISVVTIVVYIKK